MPPPAPDGAPAGPLGPRLFVAHTWGGAAAAAFAVLLVGSEHHDLLGAARVGYVAVLVVGAAMTALTTAFQAVVASRWGEFRLSTADHQVDQSAEWLVIGDPGSFMERMLREAGATLTSRVEDSGAITLTARLPGGLVTPSVRLTVTAEPVDGGFLVRSNARSAAPQMVDYGATFHAMRALRRVDGR